MGGEIINTQIIPRNYGEDLYCGKSQRKRKENKTWTILGAVAATHEEEDQAWDIGAE